MPLGSRLAAHSDSGLLSFDPFQQLPALPHQVADLGPERHRLDRPAAVLIVAVALASRRATARTVYPAADQPETAGEPQGRPVRLLWAVQRVAKCMGLVTAFIRGPSPRCSPCQRWPGRFSSATRYQP